MYICHGYIVCVHNFILQSVSASFEQWCESHGILDCAYAGLAYDAVWTVAHALNDDYLLPSDLQTAVSNANFPGVSVNEHTHAHVHQNTILWKSFLKQGHLKDYACYYLLGPTVKIIPSVVLCKIGHDLFSGAGEV